MHTLRKKKNYVSPLCGLSFSGLVLVAVKMSCARAGLPLFLMVGLEWWDRIGGKYEWRVFGFNL